MMATVKMLDVKRRVDERDTYQQIPQCRSEVSETWTVCVPCAPQAILSLADLVGIIFYLNRTASSERRWIDCYDFTIVRGVSRLAKDELWLCLACSDHETSASARANFIPQFVLCTCSYTLTLVGCPRRRFSVQIQPDTSRPAPLMFQRDVAHTKQHERTQLAQFNKAIQTAMRHDDFAASLNLAAEMKELGVTPDVTTYNQLISAASSHCYHVDARAIFDDMILLGIQPNAETFHALLYAYRRKPSNYLWPLLDKMEKMNVEPSAAVYAYVLNFFSKEASFELALKLLREAKHKNLVADLPATSTIVELLANNGHSRLAMDVAEAFERDTVRRLEPSVWIACLRAAANDLWVSTTTMLASIRSSASLLGRRYRTVLAVPCTGTWPCSR